MLLKTAVTVGKVSSKSKFSMQNSPKCVQDETFQAGAKDIVKEKVHNKFTTFSINIREVNFIIKIFFEITR